MGGVFGFVGGSYWVCGVPWQVLAGDSMSRRVDTLASMRFEDFSKFASETQGFFVDAIEGSILAIPPGMLVVFGATSGSATSSYARWGHHVRR